MLHFREERPEVCESRAEVFHFDFGVDLSGCEWPEAGRGRARRRRSSRHVLEPSHAGGPAGPALAAGASLSRPAPSCRFDSRAGRL